MTYAVDPSGIADAPELLEGLRLVLVLVRAKAGRLAGLAERARKVGKEVRRG
ncbi:hypothetical protein [Curtobacterium sp. SORGH_AS_0776]|uniref:hypothetical protein n=1 Tax=Curtobacterium sp. SORGH_AS_0776 TaxID=3041798 RepID=UPI002856A8C6|nr:hypothetical protein [Curtobacterium sp. SORGH_AS_0776]MDR6171958.1 hypothetical protein [Curtobacterium sp. SORGH_AS_0776]